MARRAIRESRADHRGGVNTAYSGDLLGDAELRRASNATEWNLGSLSKRNGSRRMHDAALPGPVQGTWQWSPAPGVVQLVAVCNGDVYVKAPSAAEYTLVAGAALSTTLPARFAPYRYGNTLYLYIACGGLRKFDGTALSTPASAPADARDVAVYKLRAFVTNATKSLYASKIGTPDDFLPANGAVIADVETYDSEPLVGLAVVGTSLLLFKDDNVARLTGIDANDLRIDTQTEGVSNEIGLLALGSLVTLEGAAFFLSDRGPVVMTESSYELVGVKIRGEMDYGNRDLWARVVAGHHKGRNQVWLSVPGPGDTANGRVWVYDLRGKSWTGPWPRAVACFGQYERANGVETLMTGGYDGRSREEDVPNLGLDDVLRAGGGGTPVVLDVTYPEMHFGVPDRVKSGRGIQSIEADLGATGQLLFSWVSELGAGSCTIDSKGPGPRNYPFFCNAKGKRISLSLKEQTGELVTLYGWNFDVRVSTSGLESSSLSVGAGKTGIANALAVAPGTLYLYMAESFPLVAVLTDIFGVQVAATGVAWQTSNAAVATVSATGVVTYVSVGTATITATLGALSAQCAVTCRLVNDGLEDFVTALGGDNAVPALYTTRRNVRLDAGGKIAVWEDGRCVTQTGRIFYPNIPTGGSATGVDFGNYTALNGLTKVSLAAWYQENRERGAISATTGLLFNGDGTTDATAGTWGLRMTLGVVRIIHNGAANYAEGTISTAAADWGPVALFVVYDGGGATNADKLKLFVRYFSLATQTWGASVQIALTFTGAAVAATWPNAPANSTLKCGFQAGVAYRLAGFVDELRVWEGTALTQGQVDAEAPGANPVAAALRYTFNGTAANSGTRAGMNGTVGADVVFCGDDLRYGPPLTTAGLTTRPPLVSAQAQFDGVDDRMIGPRDPRRDFTAAVYAMLYVGTIEDGVIGGDMLMQVIGVNHLSLYSKSATTVLRALSAGGVNEHQLSVASSASLLRAFFANVPTGTPYTITDQVFNLAQQTVATNAARPQYPSLLVGATSVSSIATAFGIVAGTLNAAQQAAFRTWAKTYYQATDA